MDSKELMSTDYVNPTRGKQWARTAETSGQRQQKPVGKDSRVVFVGWGCLCGMGLSLQNGARRLREPHSQGHVIVNTPQSYINQEN